MQRTSPTSTVVICPDKCLPSDNKEKTHLHYTHLVDAWAVGVLAYELCVGRAPFDAGNKRATIEQILNGTPTFPAWLSEQARHFITWSLTKDAKARPDVHQLAYHPWITGHAPMPKPRISPGRAASAMELRTVPGLSASGNHAHMEARHRALAAGQIGAPAGLLEGSEEGEEEEANEWMAGSVVSAPAAAVQPQQPQPFAAAAAAPFYDQQHQQQPAASSAAAPAAAAEPASQPSTRTVLESAAENLRAYVVRCQSANNLDSLRAAVLMQPPEPSNACFEPGGRFYSPKSGLLQHGGPRAGTAVPIGSAATAGEQRQPHELRVAPHDSVSSAISHGSPKPSSAAAPLPPALPSRPPALQLVRMPNSSGLAAGAAGAGAPLGASNKAPISPARSASPMPITPEGGAAPRIALFSKGVAAACSPSALSAATPRSRLSGGSMAESMQVDSASGSTSDGSSCGSAAEFVSVCSGGLTPGRGAAGNAALMPPEPVSPPMHGCQGDAAAAAAAAAPGKTIRGVLAPASGNGAAANATGGWFGLQCFLRSSRS